MTRENFENYLKAATNDLLKMAREMTWNKISGNCLYILSEINNDDSYPAPLLGQDQKTPQALHDVFLDLQGLYYSLHDINLYIYKAMPDLTVIDIRYYLKTSLDDEYRNTIVDNPPMLHSKVHIPLYCAVSDNSSRPKFDINWQHQPLHHRWKMWVYKMKFLMELKFAGK